jgi:hypothetical protein
MKKMIVLLAAVAFIGGVNSAAFAKGIAGEVIKVKGSKVIVEVSKKDVKKIAVGDTVKMSVKKAAAPAAGNDMLTGC